MATSSTSAGQNAAANGTANTAATTSATSASLTSGVTAPTNAIARLASQKISLPAGGNLPSDQLTKALGPRRAEDPLGLGLGPGERPPPPPDPDPHDPAREDREFCRSLLDDEGRAGLEAEFAEREGRKQRRYLTIEEVREIVRDHCPKPSDASVDFTCIDAELMMLLDQRTDYKIFIAGDNVFTRDELYHNYPFPEFGVQPEAMFTQQEIGVFPPKKYALTEKLEYLARDVGDESVDFVMLEDMVGQAARDNYEMQRKAVKIAKTKIYLARDQWEDFAHLQRVFRAGVRVARAQIAYADKSGGPRSTPPLLAMFGFGLPGESRSSSAPALITDTATHETRMRRIEEERVQHEARRRQLQEEAEARAALFRQREAEATKRLEEDMARIDAMVAASKAAADKRREAFTKINADRLGSRPDAFVPPVGRGSGHHIPPFAGTGRGRGPLREVYDTPGGRPRAPQNHRPPIIEEYDAPAVVETAAPVITEVDDDSVPL